jgi:putative nucleotidyltransferase with HDIG domain
VDVKTKTLLIVDDEAAILEIANEYFTLRGYNVITAGNGIEAIEKLAKFNIDCCLTDINMPEMDGLELAEYMRHLDNSIPVIIMTGYPSLDRSIKMLQNGVVDFLIKPVNLKHMELSIERVSRERQLFIENMLIKQELEKKAELEKINRELRDKVDEMRMLNNIMSNFGEMHTTSDVFKQISAMCTTLINADDSRFFIMSPEMDNPFEVASATPAAARRSKPISNGLSASTPDLSMGQEETGASIRKQIASRFSQDPLPLLIRENCGKNGLTTAIKSFIAVPLVIRKKLFGVLTASALDDDVRFSEKELFYLSFITEKAAMAIENIALYENIYDIILAMLESIVKLIQARDRYTRLHSTSVARNAVIIARELNCSSDELEVLNVAGRLHDIGKVGIRDDILLKQDKLTTDEFNEIKKHPTIGASIIGHFGLWNQERLIVKNHHERYDGTGYPDGLAREEIPLLARIIAVADVFDAMTSERIYRKQLSPKDAKKIILSGSGTHFDPTVVNAFEACFHRGEIEQPMADQSDDYFNQL